MRYLMRVFNVRSADVCMCKKCRQITSCRSLDPSVMAFPARFQVLPFLPFSKALRLSRPRQASCLDFHLGHPVFPDHQLQNLKESVAR